MNSEASRGIRWSVPLAGILLTAAVIAAYHNSFSAPFVFDDQLSITENPSIRQLWPPSVPLSPPSGQGLTVEGRPVLNFSLALNYAVGGTAVAGYHAVNLTIHLLAALTLFGLVRRTLQLPLLRERFGDAATTLALATATLWAVHPLQTESVTYVVQRTESLMGLFYLLTVYCFARSAASEVGRVSDPPFHTLSIHTEGGSETRPTSQTALWQTLSVLACALGMAAKEVMVTAPLIVFLYDRTFLAGSFRAAWRRNGKTHLALASTWIVLGLLVYFSGNRGGTIGASAGVTWWQYALCQSRAIIHYLRLALWPSPLIFDYGSDFVTFVEVAPFIFFLLALLALTAFALWRRPALGFLGAWFFVILAPTSSVVGGTRQMLAEHRMYLSLAAVVVLAVLGAHAWLGRRTTFFFAALTVALGTATIGRNHDYRSELALYADTAAKRPANAYARYNLGKALAEAGRFDEAIVHDQAAVRLRPDLAGAHYNLANALLSAGRTPEAVASYEAALKLKPGYAKAHFALGNLLLGRGEKTEAFAHFRTAVTLDPSDFDARTNLGGVALELGRLDEAQEQLELVARAQPDSLEAHFGLGNVHLLRERWAAAEREFETVLRLRPDLALARERLALARSHR